MKRYLKEVTLICVDSTPKAHLAERAIAKSKKQCEFGEAKLLSPPMDGLEGYSNFCIREMHRHVSTSHALVVQSDGYVVNGDAWTDEFLKYDYIGSPWLPSNLVGNGGFSLRSLKLLEACYCISKLHSDSPHPEDNFICMRHRRELEAMGIKFAPLELAKRFAFEGRSWNNGIEWSGVPTAWAGQFGFHSWLTPLPDRIDKPLIFHHTGDWGDVIYSLPVIKALGGGVLFLSDDNKFPFPRKSRERVTAEWVNNIKPLLEQQDYIWRASFTHGLPFSTDCDLNKFRLPWKGVVKDPTKTIFKMHQEAFGVSYPEDQPWLTVDEPIISKPIIVNLTARYRNFHFPWINLIRKYGDQMGFVGSPTEASFFENMAYGVGKSIPHRKTGNLLDAARVIAGAKVFIGNQSAPMAIALGLGKNVIQECWQGNPNCLFRRPNAKYWGVTTVDPDIEIPEEWLP